MTVCIESTKSLPYNHGLIREVLFCWTERIAQLQLKFNFQYRRDSLVTQLYLPLPSACVFSSVHWDFFQPSVIETAYAVPTDWLIFIHAFLLVPPYAISLQNKQTFLKAFSVSKPHRLQIGCESKLKIWNQIYFEIDIWIWNVCCSPQTCVHKTWPTCDLDLLQIIN